MRTETLEYFIHDEPDALRFELSGSLSGEGATDVYHAWRTGLSIIGARSFVVDLTYVEAADERGRSLLSLWRRNGARIVASSERSRTLASAILGVEFPAPSARPGLWARIKARLRGGAEESSKAEPAAVLLSSNPPDQTEFIDLSHSYDLECGVRS